MRNEKISLRDISQIKVNLVVVEVDDSVSVNSKVCGNKCVNNVTSFFREDVSYTSVCSSASVTVRLRSS